MRGQRGIGKIPPGREPNSVPQVKQHISPLDKACNAVKEVERLKASLSKSKLNVGDSPKGLAQPSDEVSDVGVPMATSSQDGDMSDVDISSESRMSGESFKTVFQSVDDEWVMAGDSKDARRLLGEWSMVDVESKGGITPRSDEAVLPGVDDQWAVPDSPKNSETDKDGWHYLG